MLLIQSGGVRVWSFVVERECSNSSFWTRLPIGIDLDRHVAKTGEIKHLVITEESAIAKGIRRMVAVTADDAREVSLAADALLARLEAIDKLTGKEKDASLKVYNLVRTVSIYFKDTRLMFRAP
jgi:hypothetical protein